MNRLLDRYLNETGIAVIGGVATLLLAALVAFVAGRLIRHFLTRHGSIDRSAAPIVVRFTRFAIMAIALLAVLDDLGVEIATILAALGIFGFAIGLALRPSLANIFTGVALFTVKPYATGDHIEAEKVEGVVRHLGLFHTEITTRDGVYVSVPNDFMWSKSIRNYSRPGAWRTDVEITVPRPEQFAETQAIILKAVADNADVSRDLPPSLRPVKFTEKVATLRLSISCVAERSWSAPRALADEIKAVLGAAGLKPVTTKIMPREVAVAKKPAAKSAASKAAPQKANSEAAAENTATDPLVQGSETPETEDHREKGGVFGRNTRSAD